MEFIGSCQLSLMTHYNSVSPTHKRDKQKTYSDPEVKGHTKQHIVVHVC